MTKKHYTSIILTLSAFVLAGCNEASTCTDPETLKTVKKLFDQQQFGQFIQAPSSIFTVQEKSATLTSADKQGGKSRCSVFIVSDLIELMKFTNQYSDADVAKLKEEAPKSGMALTKEYLVNFTVQPMASGQSYVTVLP
jgi:PBP1b-binding outer membrane lipoprotein LpoB